MGNEIIPVKGLRLTAGSSWLHHLKRHDFPDLPGIPSAIILQFIAPNLLTLRLNRASSSRDQVPFVRSSEFLLAAWLLLIPPPLSTTTTSTTSASALRSMAGDFPSASDTAFGISVCLSIFERDRATVLRTPWLTAKCSKWRQLKYIYAASVSAGCSFTLLTGSCFVMAVVSLLLNLLLCPFM